MRAIEDEPLLLRLVDEQMPLEVCPSSNVCTGVFASLEEHSVPALLAAGAFVTINTDDPPMFSTTLVDEYLRITEAFDLDLATIAQLVRNGLEAAFTDPSRKAILIDEIDTVEAARRFASPPRPLCWAMSIIARSVVSSGLRACATRPERSWCRSSAASHHVDRRGGRAGAVAHLRQPVRAGSSWLVAPADRKTLHRRYWGRAGPSIPRGQEPGSRLVAAVPGAAADRV